jgi:hypothetical protein
MSHDARLEYAPYIFRDCPISSRGWAMAVIVALNNGPMTLMKSHRISIMVCVGHNKDASTGAFGVTVYMASTAFVYSSPVHRLLKGYARIYRFTSSSLRVSLH